LFNKQKNLLMRPLPPIKNLKKNNFHQKAQLENQWNNQILTKMKTKMRIHKLLKQNLSLFHWTKIAQYQIKFKNNQKLYKRKFFLQLLKRKFFNQFGMELNQLFLKFNKISSDNFHTNKKLRKKLILNKRKDFHRMRNNMNQILKLQECVWMRMESMDLLYMKEQIKEEWF
jgi:hypothetical protein